MTNTHSVDLNLLRVFQALIEEGTVTKAGERLGLTQSAVSHSLNKLRNALDDTLFVRSAGGMLPTPRALELFAQIGAPLREINTALQMPTFDPSSAKTEFVIASNDYMISTLFPEVLNRVEKIAPGVTMWLRPNNDVNLVEELDRGTLHIAVGAYGRVPRRLQKTDILTEPFVWAMRSGHALATGEITLEAIAEHRHIDILLAPRGTQTAASALGDDGLERHYILSYPPYLDAFFREKGLSRKTGTTVSHILAVPPLLQRTDMISLIPQRFADYAEKSFDVVTRSAPYDAPDLTISMLTHRTMGSHPSISWLIQVIKEVAASRT